MLRSRRPYATPEDRGLTFRCPIVERPIRSAPWRTANGMKIGFPNLLACLVALGLCAAVSDNPEAPHNIAIAEKEDDRNWNQRH